MPDTKKKKAGDQGVGHVLLAVTQVAGWVLLIVAGCLVGLARPQSTTIADKIFQTTQRQTWDMDLIGYVGPVLIAAIACTPVGLAIYLLGLRGHRYSFPVSVVLTGLLGVAGLVAFILYKPGS